MPLAPGTRLGPFEVRALVGRGGMGEVYRAHDPRLGRDVAIKILPTSFAAEPARLRRFEQEARAVGALSHANILAVFDVGVQDGVSYLVSEFLDGTTLRTRLLGAPVDTADAIEWARQLARGLAAAHERGVVHRDLKPANIFVTRDRQIKILDFGLAKLEPRPHAPDEDTSTRSGATIPGQVLGTVGYMSPEQVRGDPADARSDIFALGTVLYEMVAGRSPFLRETT